MANEFFTILTATGRNKLANATATATPLSLTQMAVGDGDNGAYYSPTEAQTALKHEVWRGAINHLAVDANNPNWIVAELVIPDDVGGFYIREVGLFDNAGALIAVGKFPESYKPTLAAGSNKQLYVRMILEVANTTAVTLLVDPSVVLATRQYCDDKVAAEINKLDGKQSVHVATTAAIALSGLLTIDGVVLAAGDRVLVKDQATTKDNGIYVVAAGNWARAADADSAIEVTPGLFVSVEQGTVNADSVWQLVTDAPIILGTTGLMFEMVDGKTGVAAGTYRSVTVNQRGQVIGGTNPTTLAGYGITDAASQAGVQQDTYCIAAAGGAADSITATFSPAISALTNGMSLRVRAASANVTTTPTFTPNNGVIAAKTIVKGAGIALVAGDISGGGHWIELRYDLALDKWVLQNPAKGVAQALPPGTPLMWPVPVPPSWALVRDGAAISRASYADLFAALCPTRNGTTTNGSTSVTGLSSTADLYVGMPVEGAGIPVGATVATITSGTAITLSAAATASATVPIRLFYYGYGASGNSTTFGVPDDRGLTERGLDTGTKGYDKSAITGTTTNSSAAITGLSSTVGLFVGQAISGTGVPGGATIASITSATAITISSNATASGTVKLTVTGRQIGSYQADSMQGHKHQQAASTSTGVSGSYGRFADGSFNNFSGMYTDVPSTDGTNGIPSVGPETRGKNRAYLPIIVY